jgi:putative NADH-flavin reductase
MRIVVFGASGATGRHVVQRAREAGHAVTAVIRDGASRDGLEGADIVTADVMDPDAVEPLIKACDAVVSALGPRNTGPTTVQQDAMRSLIEAMGRVDVRRLVVVGSAASREAGHGPVTRILAKPILDRLLRHVIADELPAEKLVHASGLDWVIMHPPRLTNGRRTGRYRTARDQAVRGGLTISRADLADAIVAVLGDPPTSRCGLGVAY